MISFGGGSESCFSVCRLCLMLEFWPFKPEPHPIRRSWTPFPNREACVVVPPLTEMEKYVAASRWTPCWPCVPTGHRVMKLMVRWSLRKCLSRDQWPHSEKIITRLPLDVGQCFIWTLLEKIRYRNRHEFLNRHPQIPLSALGWLGSCWWMMLRRLMKAAERFSVSG